MTRNPDDRAQPDGAGVDHEFEAIVDGWRREGRVPVWPDERGPAALFEPGHYQPDPLGPGNPDRLHPDRLHPDARHADAHHPDRTRPVPPGSPRRGPQADDDHFVPPEPPPLPRIGPPAAVGLALVGIGLLLLVSPGWLGVADRYGLPLGLVGVAAGLGWLVLRLWPDAPADDDPERDDGAVL